ncbi:hypothetical protein Droror1_Dr00015528 [Drosera rotundifolia]
MAYGQSYAPSGGALVDNHFPSFSRHDNSYYYNNNSFYNAGGYYNGGNIDNGGTYGAIADSMKTKNNQHHVPSNHVENAYGLDHHQPNVAASFKRRKYSESHEANSGRDDYNSSSYIRALPSCNNLLPASAEASTSPLASGKRDRSQLPDGDDAELISRDEIDRHSPSRKDGIDALHETHLRYSYCAFIQNLGMRLELPQTTIGTAMVLCHRFFLRRSHASYDRYLIGTAALFLAAKSEETPCALNTVLQKSSEVLHKNNLRFMPYTIPLGWFEQYREQVLEAEQLMLTTLNFEIEVQHPYGPLKSVLDKLGLSQTVLVNMALTLVSQGLRSSLWLQFKPQHIAAGAAYLAAKLLNMDLDCCRSISWEFQTPPAILQDVVQQLMEVV